VDEATRQEALRIGLRSDPEAAARCIEIWATDLRADCRAIDVRTLVIHGTGDINVPAAASSARMAGYVQDSRLELIDGAPHGANVSHASQWERLVLDFLAALP
ncbi:MAG: alpha/beta hydrolase, partial [Candidatus Microthrix sp.]|uniref:alpha/beta fold hydrolase n=1 Tax=Candidatus Neomicrothrix sp. TaxID=2719034 RepID=UPI001B569CE2